MNDDAVYRTAPATPGLLRRKKYSSDVMPMPMPRYDYKKSRIRETLNLSTDADSRTDTILRGYKIFFKIYI